MNGRSLYLFNICVETCCLKITVKFVNNGYPYCTKVSGTVESVYKVGLPFLQYAAAVSRM